MLMMSNTLGLHSLPCFFDLLCRELCYACSFINTSNAEVEEATVKLSSAKYEANCAVQSSGNAAGVNRALVVVIDLLGSLLKSMLVLLHGLNAASLRRQKYCSPLNFILLP